MLVEDHLAIFFTSSYYHTLNVRDSEPHKNMQSMPKTSLQKPVAQIPIQVTMSLLLSALALKVAKKNFTCYSVSFLNLLTSCIIDVVLKSTMSHSQKSCSD